MFLELHHGAIDCIDKIHKDFEPIVRKDIGERRLTVMHAIDIEKEVVSEPYCPEVIIMGDAAENAFNALIEGKMVFVRVNNVSSVISLEELDSEISLAVHILVMIPYN